VESKRGRIYRVKYWEIIADNLSKAGWSWGCVSAIDSSGRTMWIVDAHRDDGKRFVVHADEKLTAFVELDQRFELSNLSAREKRNAKSCEASSKEVNFHSWPYTEKGRL
jgi:hypothetical protein